MDVARFSPATKLNFQENITRRIDQMSTQATSGPANRYEGQLCAPGYHTGRFLLPSRQQQTQCMRIYSYQYSLLQLHTRESPILLQYS